MDIRINLRGEFSLLFCLLLGLWRVTEITVDLDLYFLSFRGNGDISYFCDDWTEGTFTIGAVAAKYPDKCIEFIWSMK